MAAKQHNDQGFTLIEVLLVVMILGLLSAVVAFSITGAAAPTAACQPDAQHVAAETADPISMQSDESETDGVRETAADSSCSTLQRGLP